MTNREAIEILRMYKQRLDESCSNLLGNDKEAFDLAIKTLEKGDRYNEGYLAGQACAKWRSGV